MRTSGYQPPVKAPPVGLRLGDLHSGLEKDATVGAGATSNAVAMPDGTRQHSLAAEWIASRGDEYRPLILYGAEPDGCWMHPELVVGKCGDVGRVKEKWDWNGVSRREIAMSGEWTAMEDGRTIMNSRQERQQYFWNKFTNHTQWEVPVDLSFL